MRISEFQERIIFTSPPTIHNKNEFEQSILSLTGGFFSEAGELANVVYNGIMSEEGINKVDLIDEIGDVYWYLTAMLSIAKINPEDVLEATNLKHRLRFQNREYEKNYGAEKLFFKSLIEP